MEHHFTLSGTTLTVHLPSELDHCSSQQLRQEIDRLIRVRNIRCILFDFGDTEFMDSSGLGVIIGRTRNIGFFGGKTYAIHLNRQIRKIFHASGLHRIVQTEDEKGAEHE